MDLSIIVPLYNEEDSIPLLHEKISRAVQPLGLTYEILMVDDGSGDSSISVLRDLAISDTNLRVIKFRKNYGQTPAMAAGIDHARGAILITMDGDLQNDPDDIPHFLEKISEGYDIVVGWRHRRQDKLVTRKIPSRIANWLIGKVTGVPIKDNGCSLKAFRADVVKNVPLYSEMHRFIPAMLSLTGASIAEIKVRHHARQFGESKYGLTRIYKVLVDLLTIKMLVSFTSQPLRWFGSISLLTLAVAVISLVWLGYLSSAGSADSLVVPAGISMAAASASAFLLLCGVLSELAFRTGDLRIDRLSAINIQHLEHHEQS